MALFMVRTICAVFVVAVSFVSSALSEPMLERTEQAAQRYLADLEPEILAHMSKASDISWAFHTNSKNETRNMEDNAQIAQFFRNTAHELRQFDYKRFKDADLKRRIAKLINSEYAAFDEDTYLQLINVSDHSKNIDYRITVCEYQNKTNCNFTITPELYEMLSKTRDPEELQYYWLKWHEVTDQNMRQAFDKFISLFKQSIKVHGLSAAAFYEAQFNAAIQKVKPLYEQLHAYVRHKLREHYGTKIVSEKGPIPIHLLRDMFGETWENVANITAPYPSKAFMNVTEEMLRQGFTARKMFEIGDEFFQSMNMTKLPATFWEKSFFGKRESGRDICNTYVYNFHRKDDVRIHKCTNIDMSDLLSIHSQLGWIQYYLQYQHQPSVYQESPIPKFDDTVGNIFSLSASTSKYMERIGLLKNFVYDNETKLNDLYRSALEIIVSLPYSFVMDKHRWEIVRDRIKHENYNCMFWEMFSKHAGVEPPIARSAINFNLASSSLHVDDYYYVSRIMQFQFFRAACEKAGEYVKGDSTKLLSDCDISQSAAAGNALKEMMAMGSSKPWRDVMEAFTGQRMMNTDALLEYFQPLHDWLVKENKARGVHVGWETNIKCETSLEPRASRRLSAKRFRNRFR